MAKIDMMWLNDGIHGRADKTSRTYTKVDRLTGKTYAVTLRNPRTGKDFTNGQIRQNNKFGALCMGVHAWVKQAKAADASAEDKGTPLCSPLSWQSVTLPSMRSSAQ